VSQYESKFEEKLYNERREKLAEIARLGQKFGLSEAEAKFPNQFLFTATVPEVLAQYDGVSAEELEQTAPEAAVAGRLMSIRVQGKAGFAHLQQGGQRLQIYVRKDDVGEDVFALYKLLDLGDHIGVRGKLMRTRTGELTLKAQAISLPKHEGAPAISFLTKAMLALPDKYHGLEDVETRYRQRYVDLIVNSGTLVKAEAEAPGASAVSNAAPTDAQHEDAPINVREVFVKRAAVLRAIRKFFDARGYLEVETPMLHTVAGGAAARPFTTHHNALDMPLSLRIAPELYLKRLVVGGLDRVYEINRNFRNEGVSTRHNPEFTMLEFYQAYANYHDLMDLTQELIQFVAMEVNGTTVTHFNDEPIELSNWTRFTMREAIIYFWETGYCPAPTLGDLEFESLHNFLVASEKELEKKIGLLHALRKLEKTREISSEQADAQITSLLIYRQGLLNAVAKIRAGELVGKVVSDLFEFLCEPYLIKPTIIYDFPLAVSPLSKVKPDEPDWVERFEFYIGGFEVGNAFSELNDADDQRRRFEAQVADKDPESMAAVDEDYVRALGYGLPPTAGEGIGIDRLTMLLTGSRSIRDVILFPLMRAQAKAPVMEEEHGESAE
jgi:lysyl-tRNA synthetase class 2